MDLNEKVGWTGTQGILSKSYTCGYCGNQIASNLGYYGTGFTAHQQHGIYICHHCTRPTYFDSAGNQVPGKAYGDEVHEIADSSVKSLFQEARNATSSNCFTAAVLCCRKLLMHIAIAKGAPIGESFASYVEFLSQNHYVPPGAQTWIDHIRKKGNEANHEIIIMNPDDAKELIDFCGMLLKIIYEFPASVQKKYLQPKEDN